MNVLVAIVLAAFLACTSILFWKVCLLRKDKDELGAQVCQLKDYVGAISSQLMEIKASTNFYVKEAKEFTRRLELEEERVTNLCVTINEITEELNERISKIDTSQKYNSSFKEECVEYLKKNGLSIREASRQLGVPYSTLNSWLRVRD